MVLLYHVLSKSKRLFYFNMEIILEERGGIEPQPREGSVRLAGGSRPSLDHFPLKVLGVLHGDDLQPA